MNYKTTETILNAIHSVCDLRDMTISTENTDWKGRTYESDYVTLIKEHNIGFEVFDNEIIVFFFTDHCHFEDYTATDDIDVDFVDRTIEFLKRLYLYPIQYIKKTKRDKIVSEEYFSLMEDGTKDSLAGPSGSLFALSPFTQKVTEVSYWKYEKETNDFIECTLEQLGFDANTVFTKTRF